MADTITNAKLIEFPKALSTEMFNSVRGHSSLAQLSAARPQSFAGNTEFAFSIDGEAEIVGEGDQKGAGTAGFKPVVRVPVKFIYSHRVSDEFLYQTAEARVPVLQAFAEGFSKVIARGMDIAAMHGINPRTGLASSVVGDNHFDKVVTKTVTYAAGVKEADDALDEAIEEVITAQRDVNGIAMASIYGSAMGKIKVNGVPQYPEFRLGGSPDKLGDKALDLNTTINKKLSTAAERDMAIVGDFANAFRWGYAENVKLEVIEYGDPDGLGDLKRQNQVCLRSEAFIGWAIMDAASFARVIEDVEPGQTS